MGDERGAICLVEQGGEIFLVRAVLESGQRTSFFEFATSAGSGNPLTWHLVPESPETRLEPLYSGGGPSLHDRDGAQAWPAGFAESKSDFARRCNVHPARVGQWLRLRQIDTRALVGRGLYAKIIVDVALEQLHRRRGRGWREREAANSKASSGSSKATAEMELMNALALLIAKGPQDRPTNHEVNHRLGMPPGFFESAAALCIGLKHGDPVGFLAMAARLHHAFMNGGTILVRSAESEEAS